MRILSLLAISIFGVSVQAGVGAHGGNVVDCRNQPMVTLDYYNALLPTMKGPVDVVNVFSMSEDQAFQFIRSRFDGSPFQEVFDQHAAKLGPIESWIAADLKSIDDSNEPYALPANCSRKTAAARQGASMYADPNVTAGLAGAQLGLLRAHEVLYEISGKDSSAPVRDLFRVLLAKQLNITALNAALEPIGAYEAWKYLYNQTWIVDAVNPWPQLKDPQFLIEFSDRTREPVRLRFYNYGNLGFASFDIQCDLQAQLCAIGKLQEGSSMPSLQNCSIGVAHLDQMKLSCPTWGKDVTFKPKFR